MFWNLHIFITFAELALWENVRGKVKVWIFAIWNSSKNHINLLWIPNFGVFSLTFLTLKSNFFQSLQVIKLKCSIISYLVHCNNFANFYQILRWVMSKPQKFCTIWCRMTPLFFPYKLSKNELSRSRIKKIALEVQLSLIHQTHTGFKLTACDSWFMARFWIFTTGFFVIMNLFMSR